MFPGHKSIPVRIKHGQVRVGADAQVPLAGQAQQTGGGDGEFRDEIGEGQFSE